MDLGSQDPSAYASASVVQLFYLCNWYHDKLYELGFTEAAGNFQNNNFGRGGIGNDAVQADAQDGGGFNNANFSVDYDGNPGRMQMYVFNGPAPARDGDFDFAFADQKHFFVRVVVRRMRHAARSEERLVHLNRATRPGGPVQD